MEALGRASETSCRVYFTGGATAVLEGWREVTVDIDIHLVPDSDRVLQAIPEIKHALSKIKRGREKDLLDVRAMIDRRLVEPQRAWSLFRQIESRLYRYPNIDPESLKGAVEAALGPERA